MTDEQARAFKHLTPRERQVLLALMRGATAQQICKESYVSLPTVRSQIRSVLSKLGVRSQLAAVVVAYRSGWPATEPNQADQSPTGPVNGWAVGT